MSYSIKDSVQINIGKIELHSFFSRILRESRALEKPDQESLSGYLTEQVAGWFLSNHKNYLLRLSLKKDDSLGECVVMKLKDDLEGDAEGSSRYSFSHLSDNYIRIETRINKAIISNEIFSKDGLKFYLRNPELPSFDERLLKFEGIATVPTTLSLPPPPPPPPPDSFFSMMNSIFKNISIMHKLVRIKQGAPYIEIKDLSTLYDSVISLLENRPGLSVYNYFHRDMWTLLFFSNSPSYFEFQAFAEANAEEFKFYLPRINSLIIKIKNYVQTTSKPDYYDSSNIIEWSLFYVFSPLLIGNTTLDFETATNILYLIHNGFLSSIPSALIKQCAKISSDFSTDSQLLLDVIKRNLTCTINITQSRPSGDPLPKKIDSDLISLFLASRPRPALITELFFILITHSLCLTHISDKLNCYTKLQELIDDYPFLLSASPPLTELNCFQHSIIVCTNFQNTSFATFYNNGYYLSLKPTLTEIDMNFHTNLIAVIHQKKAAIFSLFNINLLKKILPEGSPARAYFQQFGFFEEALSPGTNLASCSVSEIHSSLLSKTHLLNYNRRKGNLSPSRIDLNSLIDCHNFKQQLKKIDTSLYGIVYNEFIIAYDKTIDQIPLFSDIRTASRELRSIISNPTISPSPFLRKFLVVWNQDFDYKSYSDIGSSIESSPLLYKMSLIAIREKIAIIATHYFQNPFWQSHNPFHMSIHGTKLSALIMMQKTPLEKRALKAAGTLLDEGSVPLTGELCGSHLGHNKTRISFSSPSRTWTDPSWGKPNTAIFSAPSGFPQSVNYAKLKFNPYSSSPSSGFNLTDTWTKIDLEKFSKLLDYNNSMELSTFSLYILRVRMTDPDADEKLKEHLALILRIRSETANPFFGESCFIALTKPISFRLTSEEVIRVQEATQPVIFATFSHRPTEIQIWNKEITLPTNLLLGKLRDVSVAFTLDDDLSLLSEIMESNNLEHASFSTLMLLESLQMSEGSRIQKLDVASLTESSLQSTISQAVRQFAAPHYAKPLPSQPLAPYAQSTATQIEHHEIISPPFFGARHGPSYDSYKSSLETNPNIPARDIHGVMHMLRTTLFSQIFINIIDRASTPKERYLTAMTAAYHDSARQSEGEDKWDEMSAWNLREFLMCHNSVTFSNAQVSIPSFDPKIITDEEIQTCYFAISTKDPKDKIFSSTIQKALHDADCIEIIRCLSNPLAFRKTELVVSSFLERAILDQMISEATEFIKETETTLIKSHFEYDSYDPYNDIRMYLIERAEIYPILHQYLIGNDSCSDGCSAGASCGSSSL